MGVANSRGFTLLELLVTLTVALVLLTIAIPSYRGVVARSTVVTTVNDLVGDLNYARSEAAGRGSKVYVCASRDQQTCRKEGVWTDGWIVYTSKPSSGVPGDHLLRVHGAIHTGLELTANADRLSFNSSGFAMFGCTFTATNTSDSSATEVIVASTGRTRVRGPS